MRKKKKDKRGNKKRRKLILNQIRNNLRIMRGNNASISSEILSMVGLSKKKNAIGKLGAEKPQKLLRSIIGNIF